jgi:hypothetical protein
MPGPERLQEMRRRIPGAAAAASGTGTETTEQPEVQEPYGFAGMTERRNNMNYAVVNPTTKRVENIISADSSVIETVQNASGMLMIPAEGVPL